MSSTDPFDPDSPGGYDPRDYPEAKPGVVWALAFVLAVVLAVAVALSR